MKATFQFLGTGGSAGVPVIGCSCAVCTSTDSKNRRFRPSGILRIGGKNLLIDIGPDFRSQALLFDVQTVDGLLLTHTHYDHIAGIDEIRIFNVRQKKAMPCLLSEESFVELKKRYDYFFQENLSAKIDCYPLKEAEGSVEFLQIPIQFCSYYQHNMKVTGYRIKDFAYISDIQTYDSSLFPILKGVKTLVISALRVDKSPFHFSFDEVIEFSKEIGAKEVWITHLGHFDDHDHMESYLPEHIRLAYDGLTLEFLWK